MARIQKKRNRGWTEFGLALILMAFAVAMYFRIFIANVPIGNWILIVGMLLFFPYKSFVKNFLTLQWKKNVLMLILFHVVALGYYLVSDVNNIVPLISHGLIILLSVGLTYTCYEKDLQLRKTIYWSWIGSFVCTLLSYYVMASGMAEILVREDVEDRIFDYLSPGGIAITNIACSMYFINKSKSNTVKILLLVCIMFDFFVITMSHKRTPFIVGIVLSLIYVYRMYMEKTKRWLWFVPLAAVLAYMVIKSNNRMFSENWLYVYVGVEDFINGTNQLDVTNSASLRYYSREYAFNLISHFTYWQTIFGMGYMTRWLDNPLLQSYLDMGIFGCLSFLYFIVLMPLKVVFDKEKLKNDEAFWIFCMSAYTMIGFLSTGHPYGHGKWIPVCLLLYVLNGINSRQHIVQNK